MARVNYNLDTLCAPGMHGRGAIHDGDKIAAKFLANYFKKFGLLPFMPDSSYFQTFPYDINTFEEQVKFDIPNRKFLLGRDYILHPSSGKGKGEYKIIRIDTSVFSNSVRAADFFKQNLSKKAIVIGQAEVKKIKSLPPDYQQQLVSAGCIIEVVEKKLTASLSNEQFPRPWIQVLPAILQPLPKKIRIQTTPVLKPNCSTQNVVGMIKGSSSSDSCIVVTAHYDHLGRMGPQVYFPGANDNASGVCMLVEMMSYYNRIGNRPRLNIVFIAFGAEEAGLIGSKYFVDHPLVPLEKIKFLVNLDMLGTGDEGIMVVNGAVYSKEFSLLEKINLENKYLPAIKKRGKAANSDHYFFTERGVPAFFFYTLGGVSHYHDVYDIPATLPLTKYSQVYNLLTEYLDQL